MSCEEVENEPWTRSDQAEQGARISSHRREDAGREERVVQELALGDEGVHPPRELRRIEMAVKRIAQVHHAHDRGAVEHELVSEAANDGGGHGTAEHVEQRAHARQPRYASPLQEQE